MIHHGHSIAGWPVLLAILLVTGSSCRPSGSQRVCAIDMGSNSFRRIVGTFADGAYTEFRIDSKTMGVGDDVEANGRISEPKLGEIEETLRGFATACREDGAPAPVAVGTAAFRDAPNGGRVIEIASRAGVRMEIATEQRESELAYLVGSLGRDGYAVIDNGSRSIELVVRGSDATRFVVFNLGYRIAYDQLFLHSTDLSAAIAYFRDRLLQEAAKAPFMAGHSKLVGVEFMEMAEVLFTPATDGQVFTLTELKKRLDEIGYHGFGPLKETKDIDRALPRLVVAVTMMETFGYSEMALTSRQLGAGLIIEAGMHRGR